MNTFEELEEYLNVNGIENSRFFSEEETVKAIIGHEENSGALVYDYGKLIECFANHFNEKNEEDTSEEDWEDLYAQAEDWVSFNTLRSLPYNYNEYIIYDNNELEIAHLNPYDKDIETKLEEYHSKGYKSIYKEYTNPIVIYSCQDWDDFCKSRPKYQFNAKEVTEKCIKWIQNWFKKNGNTCNAIIGISGGKDSTIVAALCAKALGPDRVIGVAMPGENQGINEADEICKYLGIRYKKVDISKICKDVEYSLGYGANSENEISKQTVQNIPPRIRMTVLYAIAQTENGRVAGTCNFSENYLGYFTKYGDGASDFEPLAKLTVTEVKQIGHYLGIPDKWVDKIPDDGLPNSNTDEAKFGFTYEELDEFIRNYKMPEGYVNYNGEEMLKSAKIELMHNKNIFKLRKIEEFNPTL